VLRLTSFDPELTTLLPPTARGHPLWALANYDLRRDDMPKFWTWARRAAEMPTGDMGALLDLCRWVG
jgi:hypothetical protein